MKIEVLYLEGCPHYLPAVERLKRVLRNEGTTAEIDMIEVRDESDVTAAGFLGSPTIRVNGRDIDPASRSDDLFGFACRRYPGGLPSEDMIRFALREARSNINE